MGNVYNVATCRESSYFFFGNTRCAVIDQPCKHLKAEKVNYARTKYYVHYSASKFQSILSLLFMNHLFYTDRPWGIPVEIDPKQPMFAARGDLIGGMVSTVIWWIL